MSIHSAFTWEAWKVSVNMHCHWRKNLPPDVFLTLITSFWETVTLPLGSVFLCLTLWPFVSPLRSSLGISLKLIPGSRDDGWGQASATNGHGVNQRTLCSFHPCLLPWQQHFLCRIWIPQVWILVGNRTDGERTGRCRRAVTGWSASLSGNTWLRMLKL